PHWRDLLLFYEYLHGDNGAGIGASHQTGWTGTIGVLPLLFRGRIARGLREGRIPAPRGESAAQPAAQAAAQAAAQPAAQPADRTAVAP
ncbi:MAG TPA: hypothetical protein VH021_05415, partial [Trebonia sp.]|nr:hypothetical protein [Trebonia sp.]